jgi:hypothetical protein
MALEMRDACERCQAVLPPDGAAAICSYECTFCIECFEAMEHVCPNCGGEIVPRPRRATEPGPMERTHGEVVQNATIDVPDRLLDQIRSALAMTEVLRAYLVRWRWSPESDEPWETTDLSLVFDDQPTEDRLPLGAEEAIDRLTAVLGDDRSGLSFGFPFSRALDSLEATGLLVSDREAAS